MADKLNIDPLKFTTVVKKLREFFVAKGFLEVHTQNRLSILAACEDPFTIADFMYAGQVWPLPQTGQMWLEHEMLNSPETPGFFCLSTSYRNEPNPVPGRHDLIFPMFEFEMKGDLEKLIELEKELLHHLGYFPPFPVETYDDVAKRYGVDVLEHEHEDRICADLCSPAVFITTFPEGTDPFWNMKRTAGGTHARKVDVILSGQETIGSAEREVDPEIMRERFYTISGGKYAEILFSKFGKKRVVDELEKFLSFKFFPRSGAGIGVTRLIRSMQQEKLLE